MTVHPCAISYSNEAERFSGRTDTFVELKTSMSIRNAGDEARFEKCVHTHTGDMVGCLLIVPPQEAAQVLHAIIPTRSPGLCHHSGERLAPLKK